jgi:hypothetical protein
VGEDFLVLPAVGAVDDLRPRGIVERAADTFTFLDEELEPADEFLLGSCHGRPPGRWNTDWWYVITC